jgi:diguanylate cyclase (GGDEF)-like protein
MLWGFLYDTRIVPLVYFDTVIFFLAMGSTVYFWMRFIVAFLRRENIFNNIIIGAGIFIFASQIVLLIINFFVPIMFSFAPDGEYLPRSPRYIALSLQIILFAFLTIYTFVVTFKVTSHIRQRYHAVCFSSVVMLAFIILQTAYPLMPFYAIGCLISTCIIHSFIEIGVKLEYSQKLGNVREIAYKDPLTNVKNVNAYSEVKDEIDLKIRRNKIKELGLIVFDLNDLKTINDSRGHEEGDEALKGASNLICNIFKHSPVYRIGGDEFCTILEGIDFDNRDVLLNEFNKSVDRNLDYGGPVVSAGMGLYVSGVDLNYDDVFKRADKKMYTRKAELKKKKN